MSSFVIVDGTPVNLDHVAFTSQWDDGRKTLITFSNGKELIVYEPHYKIKDLIEKHQKGEP